MEPNSSNNLSKVAVHYIKKLNIPITATTLIEHLEQNSYYPTLYSLSNVFEHFGIPNDSLSGSEEDLEELEPPYIAHLNNESLGNHFVLVTEMGPKEVSCLGSTKKIIKLPKEEFFKSWQKVVFVADGSSVKEEKNYTQKLRKETNDKNKKSAIISGTILMFVIVCSLFFKQVIDGDHSFKNLPAAILILATKILGTAIAILFLVLEIDKTNTFVKDICALGKKTNCNAVLNSKGSKIFGMAWSDIGLFYFVTTLLFLLIPGIPFAIKIPWLAIASTLAAPYMLFSIYYQWKVVKQWCPLCLAVQAVLGIELIWGIIYFWIADKTFTGFADIFVIATALVSIFLPILLWYTIKPILLNAKASKEYNTAYKKLLYNQQTFDSLLQQEPNAPDGWQNIGITIGNPNASTSIINVSNPYCFACADAHSHLQEIVDQNTDVNVKIIFFTTTDHQDGISIAKHLLTIATEGNIKKTEKALDDWYFSDKKEYEVFAVEYPTNKNVDEQEAMITEMNRWCTEAEIIGTPYFFINGKNLPEAYGIEELKNFLLYHASRTGIIVSS